MFSFCRTVSNGAVVHRPVEGGACELTSFGILLFIKKFVRVRKQVFEGSLFAQWVIISITTNCVATHKAVGLSLSIVPTEADDLPLRHWPTVNQLLDTSPAAHSSAITKLYA